MLYAILVQSDLMALAMTVQTLETMPNALAFIEKKFAQEEFSAIATRDGKFSTKGCISKRVVGDEVEFVRTVDNGESNQQVLVQSYPDDNDPAAGRVLPATYYWANIEELHHAYRMD